MSRLITILALMLPSLSYGIDCGKHRIYCRIVELRPGIDTSWAMYLSNLIYRHSKAFGTDPMLSVAIARQESGLSNVHRKDLVYTSEGVVRGITDFGVFQIHLRTAINYGLDLVRLKHDIDYQVYWHARILRDKLRQCRGPASTPAWTCYNTKTPSLRREYYNQVRRWL